MSSPTSNVHPTQSRKEHDQLLLVSRKQEQEISAKESRVNRLIEDCERYRCTVKDLKSTDADKTSSQRKEQDRLLAE